jgi:hypothetical protein
VGSGELGARLEAGQGSRLLAAAALYDEDILVTDRGLCGSCNQYAVKGESSGAEKTY